MANFPHSEVLRRGNRSGRFSPLKVCNDNGSLCESSNFNSHVARGRVTRRNPDGGLEKYNVNTSHFGHQVQRNFAYDRHAGKETPGQHLGYTAEYERDERHSSLSRTRTRREGTHQQYMRRENGETSGKSSQEVLDLPLVCRKPDFLFNCGISWLEMISNDYICRAFGIEQRKSSFLVSKNEPILTFSTELESHSIPHYHISYPLYQSPHQMGRQMLPVHVPDEISSLRNAFNFTVLSYNVLSDILLWQHKQLYNNCPEWTLQWEYRKNNLLKEIINYNADVSTCSAYLKLCI